MLSDPTFHLKAKFRHFQAYHFRPLFQKFVIIVTGHFLVWDQMAGQLLFYLGVSRTIRQPTLCKIFLWLLS